MQEKYLTTIFGVFERLVTYNLTQLKINNYLDSSRTYEKLLENPIQGTLENCVCLKMISTLSLWQIPQNG